MSLLIMKMMVIHNDQVIWEELNDMEEAEDHPVGEPPEVRGGSWIYDNQSCNAKIISWSLLALCMTKGGIYSGKVLLGGQS